MSKPVEMLHRTHRRLVIENFVEWDRVDIIEDKSNVLIMIRVLGFDCKEPNILGCSSIKGPRITLMREIDLVVIAVLHNETHVFAKKELMLWAIPVRHNKNNFGDFFHIHYPLLEKVEQKRKPIK